VAYSKNEFTIFGNQMRIFGSYDDDYTNNDLLLSKLEYHSPQALVLGDYGPDTMDLLNYGHYQRKE